VNRWRPYLEWLAIVAGAVVVALLIQVVVLQSFVIPSESMASTLTNGDRVLVNKLAYTFHEVRRGDVVVIERPPAAPPARPGEPEDLIKRVIGLPGETIETRDGVVYIDGRALTEPYLADGVGTDGLEQPVVIPSGSMFVMGDNRPNSVDSRRFGAVPTALLIGRAAILIWPLNRVGFL